MHNKLTGPIRIQFQLQHMSEIMKLISPSVKPSQLVCVMFVCNNIIINK